MDSKNTYMHQKRDMHISRLVADRTYKVGHEIRVDNETPRVVKITYEAGTSGVEYQVHLNNDCVIQLRGGLNFIALWRKDETSNRKR